MVFTFLEESNATYSANVEAYAYSDKGKKLVGEFKVGDKFWIVNSETSRCIQELTIKEILGG